MQGTQKLNNLGITANTARKHPCMSEDVSGVPRQVPEIRMSALPGRDPLVSQSYLVMSGQHEFDRTSLCLAFDLERENFPRRAEQFRCREQ